MTPKNILIILDGFGHREERDGNAVLLAKTPFLDSIKNAPTALLHACGNAVGLPVGAVGASEPGHLTIGAGRVVWQPLAEIDHAIETGDFAKNKAIIARMREGKPLHAIGMISDGGVHSQLAHFFSILELAKKRGVSEVFLHAIVDGRDVPEHSASRFFASTTEKMAEIGIGKIATISGRFFAMDRDTNWDRTKTAFDLIVSGVGKSVQNWREALENAYSSGIETDYFLPAFRLADFQKPELDDDFLIWNFRSDRSKQLSAALFDADFSHFARDGIFKNGSVFGPFSHTVPVAFPPQSVKNNLGSWLSEHGKRQLRIAETEKYAHVTFFFNSQVEAPYKSEDRILVPSPKCESYAEKPEMSAFEVTEKVCTALASKAYDFVALNFANPDLVGHSGNLAAAIRAVEVVDSCLSRVIPMAQEHGYSVILTADHGNCDTMKNPDGSQNPSHSMSMVECSVLADGVEKMRDHGGLSDLAPTILELLDLPKPPEMTGVSLLA